jgi:GT2 family glycosyltransferase
MYKVDHSPASYPSVAIILVNWNGFAVTNDCILSLQQLDYPNHTVIVVDNGSEDDSSTKLRALHPHVVVIRSDSNLGFTGGNNIGLQYALEHRFDYSIMLNNDTFVEPDFLDILVAYMESHPHIGGIQPRIHYHHNRSLLWNGGGYYNKWTGFSYTDGENALPQQRHLTLKKVDWITGCAFLIRNKVLSEVGLLPAHYFMYSEDVDLSFRIRQRNYTLVYHPDSVIYHIAGVSTKSATPGKDGVVNPMVHYFNQRNRLWVIKKYTPWYCWPTVLICNIFYLMLVLGYFALRGRFKKFNATCKAIKDGIFPEKAVQYR